MLMDKLLNVQKDIANTSFVKDATNPFFKSKYLTLDKVMESVLPILNKHGVVCMQLPTLQDDKFVLNTSFYSADDDSKEITSTYVLTPKNSADPQAVGSAITYARRYALCAMLGIVADEDDDGNSASKEKKQTKPIAPKRKPISEAEHHKIQLRKDIFVKLCDQEGISHPEKLKEEAEKMKADHTSYNFATFFADCKARLDEGNA